MSPAKSSTEMIESLFAKSVNPDQTAPIRAV